MASTIKVNNIQNQCGANIVNKCSTTITLGASGDTIQLACGASQTGFGRTGTVNWDTTAKTAGFTAVSGNGYFVNTTSGAITVTLPTSPAAGDIVAFADYALTWDTNNLILDPGSNKINGSTDDYTVSSEGKSLTLVYTDSTQGWKVINDGNSTAGAQAQFIVATGGTITCCGDYKIHTFTGPGTFTVCSVGNPAGSNTVDYLVVAGGGGGGQNTPFSTTGAGAGGAGGYRESSGEASGCYTASPLGACVSALPVSAQGYPITVGAGGAGSPCAPDFRKGCSGSNSIFSTITSAGGGGGGSGNPGSSPSGVNSGAAGGSGGGSSCQGSVGSGNTPPVSPPQGNNGGFGTGGTGAGGGGGAGAVGGTSPGVCGASGGNGVTSSINASPVTRAGGGGGGGNPSGGSGGSGGGGNGASSPAPGSTAGNGTANTGGGGGGGSANDCHTGGSGGSGIVIIRYKFQ